MRLFRIHGDLGYYQRSELGDETPLVERAVGSGWGVHSLPGAQKVGTLEGLAPGGFRVKFIDVVVAAPKSVSVAYALGGAELREQVARAHLEAVDAAISLMERVDLAVEARDGRLEGGGLRGVQLLHRLSRELDPHLHSHVVVVNGIAAFGVERAIDHWRISRTLPAYELAYRSELRQRLLPAGIVLRGEGLGRLRVEGQEPGLQQAFSTRRLQVLSQARSAGPRARQVAALATRRERVAVTQPELDRLWLAKARAVPAGWPDQAPPSRIRIPDPFLSELAKQLSPLRTGTGEALAKTLASLFGPEIAAGIERGQSPLVAGERLELDGSIARTYRRIPLAHRLSMAGVDLDRVRLLPAPSLQAGAVLDAIASAGNPRPLRLIARSQREEEYLRSLGQIPDAGRGTNLLVDAGSMAPSEIAALSRGGGLAVVVPGADPGRERSPVVEVAAERGSLVVSERAVDLWGAFVEEAASSLRDGSERQFVVDSPALVNRLRGEIAAAHPELVAGSAGSRPLFRGERASGTDGRSGRVASVTGASVELGDAGGSWSIPASQLQVESTVARAPRPCRAVSYYGARPPSPAGRLSVYLAAPGSSALDLLAGDRERLLVDDATVRELSSYRLRALELGGGRVAGEAVAPFFRARRAERELASLFQRVHQLGLDDRAGHDRVLDAYLSQERRPGGEGRSRELPGLTPLTAGSWRAWPDGDAPSW